MSDTSKENKMNINIKDLTSEQRADLLKQLQEEESYPMWFESLIDGAIVKFTAIKTGEIVTKGNQSRRYEVGYKGDKFIPHTDTTTWEKVEEPKPFPAKGTICLVKDGGYSAIRLRVSDGISRFYQDGTFEGDTFSYDSYEPLQMGITFSDEVISSEQITIDMDKKLALCWNYGREVSSAGIRVIDGKNKCCFYTDGIKSGIKYDNYRLCTTTNGNLDKYFQDIIYACEDSKKQQQEDKKEYNKIIKEGVRWAYLTEND